MSTTAIPIALRRTGGRVMAAGPQTLEAMYSDLDTLLRTGFSQRDEQLQNLQNAIGDVQNQINAGGQSVFGGASIQPVEPEYSRAFASYIRRGDNDDKLKAANAVGERATVQAALSIGDASSGGFLAPVEWDRKLQERQRSNSPMRRLAYVQSTTVGAFTTLWNNDQWGSGWVGETAVRPVTSSTGLAPITFAAGEIYAMPAATQRLLDDSAINVETWLAQNVEREFDRQEAIAFISGSGVNKPAGLLTYVAGGVNETTHPGGALDVLTAAITVDSLTDFLYGLGAPYRQNATWLMSSLTAAFIAKIKDGDGRPIWRESLLAGQPATLLGRPVEIDEAMPLPTSGNLAVAFGDFRAGYLINDRFGTRILRDPYTNKPYVNFYITKRVGGGVLDPFAIRLLKVGT